MWVKRVSVLSSVLALALVIALRPQKDATPHPEVTTWLDLLEIECDPDSPENNYDWTTNAPPTEKKRMGILKELAALGPPALADIHARLKSPGEDEFLQMLDVAAATLGDPKAVLSSARHMVYSAHPGVRVCASQILRKLGDPRTVEWFQAALLDDRCVRNDACGIRHELFYPVRTTAELALLELGHSEDEIARWSRGAE